MRFSSLSYGRLHLDFSVSRYRILVTMGRKYAIAPLRDRRVFPPLLEFFSYH
ncbi:hypothetical protein [Phormidium sp. CCY1219]|uniref:hypothetical protein n=1 Tax=Phormidium sp. CCY1219 TaxID=2886104 RepID=UPI002D1E6FDD|nr:hypothetical protein [Phormidium sp. CCY1219]MEB3828240.1 hypothetical protein [Phormidium sp. CCY1219]